MSKYLELPWSVDDTIEDLKELKEGIQKRLIIQNLHGRGEKDAEEIAFDFDRAIKALEEVQQYRAIGTVEECRAAVEIIRYMIQEGIEPEVLEAYVWFEDELAKKGFTVKSVMEAREKQTAAKPLGGKDIEGNEYAICRECSAILSDGEWFAQYCPDCGKKVDWREKE